MVACLLRFLEQEANYLRSQKKPTIRTESWKPIRARLHAASGFLGYDRRLELVLRRALELKLGWKCELELRTP